MKLMIYICLYVSLTILLSCCASEKGVKIVNEAPDYSPIGESVKFVGLCILGVSIVVYLDDPSGRPTCSSICEIHGREKVSNTSVSSTLPEVINLSWHVEDVLSRADEQDLCLTRRQATEILHGIAQLHDASIGVNWEVIDIHIDNFFSE